MCLKSANNTSASVFALSDRSGRQPQKNARGKRDGMNRRGDGDEEVGTKTR